MSEMVETTYGYIRGVEKDGVRSWRGIPYAKAPVGEDRFREPRPPEPWSGIKETVAFGPIAVQTDAPGLLSGTNGAIQSEDCLNLNVWSPSDALRAPVLVWIHGGGYVFGSGSTPWYEGTSFARTEHVVVVTINYRLGPFGFLSLKEAFGEAYAASGNVALLDQVMALKWVRDNIVNFGGDPSRVTVAGESAGSWSIATLMTMPAAHGLFHQAICESGVIPRFLDEGTAARTTHHLLETLGIGTNETSKLQEISASDWMEASKTLTHTRMPWLPVLDDTILPQSFWEAMLSGSGDNIRLLIGTNRDEVMLWGVMNSQWKNPNPVEALAAFEKDWDTIPSSMRPFYLEEKRFNSLLDGMVQYATMHTFRYPSIRMAALQSQHAPVWMYRFDWPSRAYGGILKASHAMEIPFVFHTLDAPGVKEITGDAPDRVPLANAMHHAWSAFVHHGDPQTSDLPGWPQYHEEQRATMIFNTVPHLEYDPEAFERRLFEDREVY